MQIKWQFSQDNVDWTELSELYRRAPLGDKRPADLETAFTNSRYKCFVYHSGKMIGVGRALADGIDCSYICDVAIHPEYQGKGLGKNIIQELIDRSNGHKKIILYSYPGKEGFYNKLGFRRMCTAMAIFANQEQALEWGLIRDDNTFA